MNKTRKTLVYENMVKLLSMSKVLEPDYLLWSSWLRDIASALYLEHRFLKDFEVITRSSKKEILSNLDGLCEVSLNDWRKEDALKWCEKTYDTYHKLRFSVETIDSIESVRTYLCELLDAGIGFNEIGLVFVNNLDTD